MQHHYLKSLFGLSIIGLLAIACKKEGAITPEQPASIASTSGGSQSSRSRSAEPRGDRSKSNDPKNSKKSSPPYITDSSKKIMLQNPKGNFSPQKDKSSTTYSTTTTQRPTSNGKKSLSASV